MSSAVPNVYTSVTLHPWQNRRKIIMHSCEQWFIFPGIGDYTTLCWDFTKPLKGSLFNRQKNGKYSKWFLLVAHISFAWRFDLGIWSIGLPPRCLSKNTDGSGDFQHLGQRFTWSIWLWGGNWGMIIGWSHDLLCQPWTLLGGYSLISWFHNRKRDLKLQMTSENLMWLIYICICI